MMMKRFGISFLLAASLLLAGCSDLGTGTVRMMQGKWRPIYASGSYEDAAYVHTYDGPVNAQGEITGLSTGKDHPEVQYDHRISFSGLKFYRKGGEDLFLQFSLDPGKNSGSAEPLHYRIAGDSLYFEMPNGYFVNGDSADDHLKFLQEGSGKYRSAPFTILDDNTVHIGTVTYSRMK